MKGPFTNRRKSSCVEHGVLANAVMTDFVPRFAPGGTLAGVGDPDDGALGSTRYYLQSLGFRIPGSSRMPDMAVHDATLNRLFLIDVAVTGAPTSGRYMLELIGTPGGCRAEVVFVVAFATRKAMAGTLTEIRWETVAWIADEPEHLIHFNGSRLAGPYPGVVPQAR